ncbi:hypothetical protein NE236_00025 [Actinoallomurus purpureus]|uniref:hypothetical protein n=1 Tax=Actinoallomurus purpureus TaxID=478114 RepID=UPI002092A68B|nr:hypothetical protein [Actinoallomurus purpureus]MCO6003363.1 hypothetical protein [Actinoallomurus purpureus]
MKTSTKLSGVTLAGLTTAGVAIAAIGSGPSTTVARNVGQSRHFTAAGDAGQVAVRPSDTAPHRSRPARVALTSRYAVTNVRAGHSVAVLRKIGRRWRAVGTLRSTDRRVWGATVPVRRPTTVVAVAGHRAVTLIVPPRAVVVVADNGRIGVVGWRFLKRVVAVTPTAPPTTAPTPTPSGSQSPVVGGLQNRVSTKW